MKVVGYETIMAESEEDALDKFEELQRDGYTIFDLRWVSVTATLIEE